MMCRGEGFATAPVAEFGVRPPTGAGSCTGAEPAGTLRAPPVAGAASAPPPTPSACRSAPPLWSLAAGGKRTWVSKKGRVDVTGQLDPAPMHKDCLGNTLHVL